MLLWSNSFLMPKKSILDGVFFLTHVLLLVFTISNIFTHGEDEIVLFLILYIIGHQ